MRVPAPRNPSRRAAQPAQTALARRVRDLSVTRPRDPAEIAAKSAAEAAAGPEVQRRSPRATLPPTAIPLGTPPRGAGGRPLPTAVRQGMEHRMGHDFSRVRIHADGEAAAAARQLQARAFTVGHDIFFAERHFAPATSSGRRLIAHELAHVQQVDRGPTRGGLRRDVVARDPDPVAMQADLEQEGRQVVGIAADYLDLVADYLQIVLDYAAIRETMAPGPAAAARAVHEVLNQERLGSLLAKAIDAFEQQRRQNPHVRAAPDSAEQTRLGESYARALERFRVAMEAARANAANLAPAVEAKEQARYDDNRLRWLAANPAAPQAVGQRTAFTNAELNLSTQRHQETSTWATGVVASLHTFNLAGDRAGKLRDALQAAPHRLERDAVSGGIQPGTDANQLAQLQPAIDQLDAIQWAVDAAIARLDDAEGRTRAFAGDPTGAHPDAAAALSKHFSTSDPGYATLLADRLARMAMELRGQGQLEVHAPDANDAACDWTGTSSTRAHADANRFYFCGAVARNDHDLVSTVIHEAVHAVIPNLGALSPVRGSADTPADRAYEFERMYEFLSTEEALANAESYAFYVDDLVGAQVQRTKIPTTIVNGCADDAAVKEAVARAMYHVRLGARWADQYHGQASSGVALTIIQGEFPSAKEADAKRILRSMAEMDNELAYFLTLDCRAASDKEAKAGALAYGPKRAVTATALQATQGTYTGRFLRLCPAWFKASQQERVDTLTALLILRVVETVAVGDVMGIVNLARFIKQEVHTDVSSRSLQQHQAADAGFSVGSGPASPAPAATPPPGGP